MVRKQPAPLAEGVREGVGGWEGEGDTEAPVEALGVGVGVGLREGGAGQVTGRSLCPSVSTTCTSPDTELRATPLGVSSQPSTAGPLKEEAQKPEPASRVVAPVASEIARILQLPASASSTAPGAPRVICPSVELKRALAPTAST